MRKTTSSLRLWITIAAMSYGLLPGTSGTAPAQTSTSATREKDRIVISQPLPKFGGENLKVTIVEVTYGPGQSSPPHSHPCPVIVYVVEGSVRSEVRGEAEKVYKAGQSFYEAPNGVHEVSANASQTRPAKLVAYFVCDRDVPLDVPPLASKHGGQP